MLRDIARTPAVLDALLRRVGELSAFARAHLSPGPDGRLYAFGCGDGLIAAQAASGPGLVACTALDMLAYIAPTLCPADRVLAISMSGNVDRGLEAAEAAQASGAGVAVLTNGAGGKLGSLGLPLFSLDVASMQPFLCGTSTYSATLLALLLLTCAVTPEDVRPVLDAMPDAIDRACDSLDAIPGDLPGARFLSAGRDMAGAALGSAKLVEVTRLPTWFCDVEEFAHSQFWSAKVGELIVYLTTNAAVAGVAAHSAAQLGAMGFPTLAIETAGAPVPSAAHRIVLPATSDRLSPLALALPIQVLAWHLARVTGLDPDTRTHLREDALRFRTSRGLTRRALTGTGQ